MIPALTPISRMISHFILGLASLCLAFFLTSSIALANAIKVGVYDNHPIVFLNVDGSPQGLAIDVLEHVARQEGWSLEYVSGEWQAVLRKLKQGEIDILVGIAYSEERGRQLDFTSEVLLNNWGVVLQGSHASIHSMEQLSNKRVALMDGSIHSTVFRDRMNGFGFEYDEIMVATYQDGLWAVIAGTADVVVVNRVFSLLARKSAGIKETGIIFNPIEVHFASNRGKFPEVIAALDRRLADAKQDANSFYYAALDRWLAIRVERQWSVAQLLWGLGVFAAILVIVLTHNLVLSRRVKHRTLSLARSKAEFEAIFNSISDPVIYSDKESRILMANPAVQSVFGYRPEDLVGQDFNMLCEGSRRLETSDAHSCPHEQRIKTDLFEAPCKRRDGSFFTGEILHGEVIDLQGHVLGMLCIVRDVTVRRNAERELLEYRDQLEDVVAVRTRNLEEINKELEAFSYSVSHDLRAPLRAIGGFCDALSQDYGHVLDSTGKDYLRRARNAAQRMSLLIDELLKLSRVVRGELRWQEVDIAALARISLRAHDEMDPDREVECDVQQDLRVHGDKHLLQIMMDNLVDNAWKYTQAVVRPKIEIGSINLDGGPVFFVRDNGIGFDMSYKDKLFTPFQRLHSDERFEGNGVGLATVQRIIVRHGGEVWAESSPGLGTSFFFRLSSVEHVKEV